MSNESVLRTFLELADNLIDDFDVVELLTFLTIRCVEILDVTTAGVMLVAPEGDLRCVATSSEASSVLEIFDLQSRVGPRVGDFEVAEHVSVENAATELSRWPLFGPALLRAGFSSMHAFPMKSRGKTIGSFNILRKAAGAMGVDDLLAAQALSKFATIIVLQQRISLEPKFLSVQLSSVLKERSLLETAKSAVAAGEHIGLEDAFIQMRTYALKNNQLMGDVAQEIIERSKK